MKKKSLVCGLVSALTLGICSTSFAESLPEAAPDTVAPVSAVETTTDAESLEDLRARLEAKLQSTKELKARLNAKIEELDKRIMTEQRKQWTPKVQMWGYTRLRHDRFNYGDYKSVDNNYIRLNLYSTYHIDDNWKIRNETEFDNNLTHNGGAYGPESSYYYRDGGKQYSRRILQLFAEGRIGEVDVKAGRYFLESPYKFTIDEKVDGIQLKWGKHVKWGDANISLSAGNIYSRSTFGDPDLNDNFPNYRYGDEAQRHKLIAVMGKLPIAKNTNMVATFANLKHRDQGDFSRNTFAIGFDTQLARELTFRVATSKSNSKTLNRSHYMSLQYKQAEPAIPGSYGVYVKKYLMRGHGGVSKWFMDDLSNGPSDFTDRIREENPGAPDPAGDGNHAGEFNGFAVGVEFVPVRSTKLKLEYIFGDYGLFNWKTGDLTGKKQSHSNFVAQWELYF